MNLHKKKQSLLDEVLYGIRGIVYASLFTASPVSVHKSQRIAPTMPTMCTFAAFAFYFVFFWFGLVAFCPIYKDRGKTITLNINC